MQPITIILLCLAGYLSGSLLFAPWVCRILNAPPPHLYGSRNPGTTNVYRIAGPGAAILTLIGDALKGYLPIWLAQAMGAPPMVQALVALCAIAGHMLPVFTAFRGGKGVATTLGAGLALAPATMLALTAVWLYVARKTRISSLASVITAVTAPVVAVWLNPAQLPTFIVIALMILIRHRDNLIRLTQGQERKL